MEYNYSFSGADCDVWAYRNSSKSEAFLHLKTIATLSTSVYESKSPVRRLGRAGVVGYTGATRTIAGSMIFILTGEHPLKELHAKNDRKYIDSNPKTNSTLSGVIAPFNMLIILSNEVGESMMYRLEGVEVVSEGIVSSANDMTSELVIQFVATDMLNIRKHTLSRIKKEEVMAKKSIIKKAVEKTKITVEEISYFTSFINKALLDNEVKIIIAPNLNRRIIIANKIIRASIEKIGKEGNENIKKTLLEIFTNNEDGSKTLLKTFEEKYNIYNGAEEISAKDTSLLAIEKIYKEAIR